jgi:hypothetical protein
MTPRLTVPGSVLLLMIPLAAHGAPPSSGERVLAGKWSIEFTNGVTQVLEIREDGTGSVIELALARCEGTLVRRDGSMVIDLHDGRKQRFTPLGSRLLVEHWPPGATADAPPILGIATPESRDAPADLRYTDVDRGMRLRVPEEWAVVPAAYSVMHYRDVFLCINSQGDRTLRMTGGFEEPVAAVDPEAIARLLAPGAVYLDLAFGGGPWARQSAEAADTVNADLQPLLKDVEVTSLLEGKLSEMHLGFVKNEQSWSIAVYMREPVDEALRQQALDVLASIQFLSAGSIATSLPVGRWNVTLTNAVRTECEFGPDGGVDVFEPVRRAHGHAEFKDGTVIVTFEDDRIERWSHVGPQMIVEHWYPGSAFPCGRPVLGIAERTP